MTKYIIWKFDKKTKAPEEVTSGDYNKTVIDFFKNLLKEDKENSYALRISR